MLPQRMELPGKWLILVHRTELAQQAFDKISKWNPDLKVEIEMGSDHACASSDVVIASVQTLGMEGGTRINKWNPEEFAGVVIDECHRSTAATYTRVLEHFGLDKPGGKRLLLGVTATVNRADGQGLDKVYDAIAYELSLLDAVRQGWLVDLKGIRVVTGVSLDGVKITAGDFNPKQLEDAINTPARNKVIVQEWLKHAERRRTVAFTVDIQHAKDLAAMFREHDVKAEAVWGTDPNRKEKLAQYAAGQFEVLTNSFLLVEGWDDPETACVLQAKPTRSLVMYQQQIGRGDRLQASVDNLLEARKLGQKLEKEDCLIIDVVDNTTKHSLVTVPSLMGLNPDLDLKGESVVFAKDRADALQAANPLADMSKVTDIEQLRGDTIPVDLWKVEFAPEVLKETRLQWHKTGESSYLLSMKSGQGAVVWQDSLNKWHVKAVYGQNKFDETFDTRKATFGFAERMAGLCNGDDARWLTRNNSWGAKPATKNQLDYLRRRGVAVKEDITSGQANQIINRLQAINSVGAAQ
jgi:ATP-dependent helicase IRC3